MIDKHDIVLNYISHSKDIKICHLLFATFNIHANAIIKHLFKNCYITF